MAGDLPQLFLLGVASGLTVCGASCLVVLAPALLGREGGFASGARDALAFLGGKALAYGALGWAAAASGAAVPLPPGLGPWLRALALVGMGLSVLRSRPPACRSRAGLPGLCAFGFATSLVPCAPLAGLCVLAAQQPAAWHGAVLGLTFGAGIAAAPVAIAGGSLVSGTGAAIRAGAARLAPVLRTTAAAILIASGVLALVR